MLPMGKRITTRRYAAGIRNPNMRIRMESLYNRARREAFFPSTRAALAAEVRSRHRWKGEAAAPKALLLWWAYNRMDRGKETRNSRAPRISTHRKSCRIEGPWCWRCQEIIMDSIA